MVVGKEREAVQHVNQMPLRLVGRDLVVEYNLGVFYLYNVATL